MNSNVITIKKIPLKADTPFPNVSIIITSSIFLKQKVNSIKSVTIYSVALYSFITYLFVKTFPFFC